MAKSESASEGLPSREKVLEHLRSQGRRPLSLPSLEERFDIPRDRSRAFQGILHSLEEDGMVRKVKGRKFVAEDENGPAARKREKRAKEGKAGKGKAASAAAKP